MLDDGLALGMGGTRHTPLAFQNAPELGNWLAKHHQSATELWVRIFKAGAGRPSVTWTDCVVEAIQLVGQELLSCDDADRGWSDDFGRLRAG